MASKRSFCLLVFLLPPFAASCRFCSHVGYRFSMPPPPLPSPPPPAPPPLPSPPLRLRLWWRPPPLLKGSGSRRSRGGEKKVVWTWLRECFMDRVRYLKRSTWILSEIVAQLFLCEGGSIYIMKVAQRVQFPYQKCPPNGPSFFLVLHGGKAGLIISRIQFQFASNLCGEKHFWPRFKHRSFFSLRLTDLELWEKERERKGQRWKEEEMRGKKGENHHHHGGMGWDGGGGGRRWDTSLIVF